MMAVARAHVGSGPIAPEKIGGVQIVVGPERRERGQQRRKLGVKGREEFEGLLRRRRERLCDSASAGRAAR